MNLTQSTNHSPTIVVVEHLTTEDPVKAVLSKGQRRHLRQHLSKYVSFSSNHQSAVRRPCISTIEMSSATAHRPMRAKVAAAQHVLAPTSRML